MSRADIGCEAGAADAGARALSASREPSAATRASRRGQEAFSTAGASLLAIGLATPELRCGQEEIGERMGRVWGLGAVAMERWRRIVRNTGVEFRHAVTPFEDVVHLSTAERMRLYERHAPALAASAAARALENAGVSPSRITDLIVVSCTGMTAPGIDAKLVGLLGLAPTVRRTAVGFMGCFGAISGLRTAAGACAATPGAVALVVCVELCSLHVRADRAIDNQIASALFADGAAAAVVAGPQAAAELRRGGASGDRAASAPIGAVTPGASLLIPEGADWMTWRVTDTGFAMTLTRDVPPAIERRIGAFVESACAGEGIERAPTLVVHPGGPGIIDAVEAGMAASALGPARGLDAARETLRRFGNVSSASALFVLAEAMERGEAAPFLLLAFGPGLTMESLVLKRGNGE